MAAKVASGWSTDTARAARASRRQARRMLLWGLLLAVGLRAAHELVGAGVLPALTRDLNGEAWAGPFFSVFGLASAAGILTAGGVADRSGPAPTLAFGLAGFGIGMLATGLAPSMPAVVAARALEGFGAGVVACVVSAAVIRAYDDAARARVLAWLSAAWVIPGLIAPALAVGVADLFGWRFVFLGLVPLVGLAAVLALPGLYRQGGATAARANGSASAAVFGNRDLLAALAARALVVFAFFGVESFLPLALSTVRAAPAREVAAVLTLSALTWTAGSFLHSRWSEQFRPAALTGAGALLLVAGIAGACAALLPATPRGVALASWCFAGFGMGVAYTAATAAAMRASAAGAEGATGAALGITDALSASLATAVGGALLARTPLVHGSAPRELIAGFAFAAALGALALLPARGLRASPLEVRP
jgi:MFS family permease